MIFLLSKLLFILILIIDYNIISVIVLLFYDLKKKK